MKKIFVLLMCSVLLSCNDAATGQTVVKGTLEGKSDATLYVSYIDEKGYKDDVVEVKGGKFEWSKPIAFPTRVNFALTKSSQPEANEVATIWTEPGVLELTLRANDLRAYKLSGSKLDNVVKAFEKQFESEMQKLQELGERMQTGGITEEEKTRIIAEYKAVSARLAEQKMRFLEQHPDSRYSASLLFESKQYLTPEQVQRYLNLLTGDAAASQYAGRMRQDIQGEIDGAVGSKAPVFSGTDINGRPFDLAELIGEKYIILDFWASWCVPCRRGNPHLKELHNKYRNDGLVVVCSADNDSSEPAWRKAVAYDGIEQFIHVLRGWGGMENFFDPQDNSAKYGVRTLPTKFLIGKDGVIVGRYGDGGAPHEAIDAKLAEIFGH